MPDDKSKRGGQDRKRINVNEDYELRDWSKKFGVSQDELKAAVKAVGASASAVEKHLKGKQAASGEVSAAPQCSRLLWQSYRVGDSSPK